MKQLIIPSLSFYFYIVICFAGSFLDLKAFGSTIPYQHLNDQQLLDTYTTLKVIKRIQIDVQNKYDDQIQEDNQSPQPDFMIDVMVVLFGTYEKIVGATVTHYVMINMPMQQNLQSTVARIIAEDLIKIISILGKQLMNFIFSKQMTLQEKIWHCAWVFSVIIMIKIGIDQLPVSTKPQQPFYNSLHNGSDSQRIQGEESVYLTGKFGNWS